MAIIATTTVDVLRGTTTTVDGDVKDSNTAVLTRVPVAITQKSRLVLLPDSGEGRTIRQFVGRVYSTTVIKQGDRLRDNRTGVIYLVDEVTMTTSLAQMSTTILDLRVV